MAIPPPPTQDAIAARLRAVLPARWFPDDAPVLDIVLAGLAAVWTRLFAMLDAVRAQTRIATATASGLDLIALDFFGARLQRRPQQTDASLRISIGRELLRERATRPALTAVLSELSQQPPRIFEPSRPADTGAWCVAGGYGVAGGWGSLALPYQCFIDITPTAGTGLASIVGWNGGAGWGVGPVEYAVPDMLQGPASGPEIDRAIAAVMPASAIAWVRIHT